MPKYRKLHVKTVESMDMNDMPDDFHRLLWIMLPLGLCREGRGIDNPSWIRAKIMPLRTDVTDEMIQYAMSWYANRGMITRYDVNGRDYFYIASFRKYQGNTTKEAESDYPSPAEFVYSDINNSQELVNSRSGVDQELVKPKQQNIYTASASEYMNTESEYLTDDALQIFAKVTGMTAFMAGSITDDIRRIQAVFDEHGQDTVDFMQPYYDAWIVRGYRKTNTSWMDWAIAEEIPKRKQKEVDSELEKYR